jgi:hypothetical protein
MKHKKGCTFGWDGSCVLGCPYHRDTPGRRLANVREASGVEAKFVNAAKERHWQALKFVSPGLRGVPDRMVMKGMDAALDWLSSTRFETREEAEAFLRELLALVIEFAELKQPGKKATLEQMRMHEKFDKLGFHVDVIDTAAAVEEWYGDRR